MSDQTPEMTRMIEPAKVHELVDEHVIANVIGHQQEPPVEADMSCRGTGTPPRSLVAYADTRHSQPMMIRQLTKPFGQLSRSLGPQFRKRFRRVGETRRIGYHSGSLALDPSALLFDEQFSLAP
jgi:hypothetical protein